MVGIIEKDFLKEKREIPIYHFELSNYIDDRFKKVKIWVAHTGLNLNNTIFSKDSLIKLGETLPYTPIVGFLEENKDGEDDFSDHRIKMILKDNDLKVEYMGQAFGFIPENSNYKIENREGKEWLTCEGYLWTKFKKAIEIIEKANGSKSHSMEIDNLYGFVDEDGRFNIEDCRASGLCILGEYVPPAMSGSTVDFFSADNLKSEIRQMIQEFSVKEVNTELENEISKEQEQEQLLDENTDNVEETVSEETTNIEADTDKDEVELEELSEQEEVETEEVETETDEQDSDSNDGVYQLSFSNDEVYQLSFSLSHNDIRRALYKEINEKLDDGYCFIIDVFDDHFIYEVEVYGEDNVRYFESHYLVNDDVIQVDNTVEVFPIFLTKSEMDKVEMERETVKYLEQKIAELQEFKNSIEYQDKKELLDFYASEFSEDEIEVFNSKLNELDKESLEKEIAFSLFKKSKLVNEPKDEVKVGAYSYTPVKNEAEEKYGEYGRLFK